MANYTHGEDYLECTEVTITETERFRAARLQILAEVNRLKAKKQRQATYGHISRRVQAEHIVCFEDALRELAGEGYLTWNPNQPSPSVIRW